MNFGKYIVVLFVCAAAVLSGCKMTERAAVKKMKRVQKQHPHLFQSDSTTAVVVLDTIVTDTVTMPIEIEGHTATLELVVELGKLADSVKVMEGRLKLSAKLIRDLERGQDVIFVRGECVPDTIIKKIPVPTRTVVRQLERLPCTVEDHTSPWWYVLLSGLVSGLLVYFFGPRSKAVKNILKQV